MANTVQFHIIIISIFPRLVTSTCAADASCSKRVAKQQTLVGAAVEPNNEAIDMFFFCSSNDDVVIHDLVHLVSSRLSSSSSSSMNHFLQS